MRSMRHHRWLALTCTLCCILTNSGVANAAGKRPNIIFIFSDDHATQAVGAYGSKVNKTPNIDRIANEGAVFLNSFCANSICGPSRACILTGKHSHKNGFLRNGDRFNAKQTTFPKLLQKAGYQTAVIGKWHLTSDPEGFDHWEVLPGQGSYYNPDFIQMDGKRQRFEGYCTDLITDKSLEWLRRQRDQNRPFMLMCQHKAPHRGWAPHPRHFSLFKDQKVPEPETLFDDYRGRTELLKQNEMTIKDHMHWAHDMKFHGDNLFPDYFVNGIKNGEYVRMTPEQRKAWDAHYEPENREFIEQMQSGLLNDKQILSWKYQRYIKDYLRCIAAVDDGVGRLLNYLDESGLADNTIIIYSSDQGFYLGEHGWYDKRWMFEESLQMPFVIRWPKVVSPGTRATALIQNIDYAPTFLEIAGAEVPGEMQGRSLLPILKSRNIPADWRDAIYYAYYENAAAHNVPVHDGIRTIQHKLMYFPRAKTWQLFDLDSDPQEMQTVHTSEEYSAVFRGLKKRYFDIKEFYEVNSAVIPQTRGDDSRWRTRNKGLVANTKNADIDLVFVGDSITQGWAARGKAVWKDYYSDRKAANLGIGGDRTENVIWRLTHGNLRGTTPKVAVVMIGTNNTGHMLQRPAEVAEGVQRILEIIADKSPNTKVVLHGIFPRGRSKFDLQRLNNIAINERIRRLANGDQVHYLDISNTFLEPDGTIAKEIMPDALHLSQEGYLRWAKALEPKLVELGL